MSDEFQRPSSGRGRRLFLGLLLLVAIGALAYDFLVARPAYTEGLAKLQTLDDPERDNNGEPIYRDGSMVWLADMDADGRVEREDVHKYLEKEPSHESSPDDINVIETYSWPRGIPFMTYNAYVLYVKGEDMDGEKYVKLYSVMDVKPTDKDLRQGVTIPEDLPADLEVSAGGGGGDTTATDDDDAPIDPDDPADEGDDDKADDDNVPPPPADDDKADDDKADDDKADDDKADDDGNVPPPPADDSDDDGDGAGR
jgi:hypothetical protein